MQQPTEPRKLQLKEIGLHYCRYYDNIVRFNEPACGKCVYCTYPRK